MQGEIIATDFDGTLCTHAFPDIGPVKECHERFIAFLKEEQKSGTKLILWTCRAGEYLKEAVDWAVDMGIIFDAVNDDIPEIKNSDFGRGKSQKIFANRYFDDRNGSLARFGFGEYFV